MFNVYSYIYIYIADSISQPGVRVFDKRQLALLPCSLESYMVYTICIVKQTPTLYILAKHIYKITIVTKLWKNWYNSNHYLNLSSALTPFRFGICQNILPNAWVIQHKWQHCDIQRAQTLSKHRWMVLVLWACTRSVIHNNPAYICMK